MAALDNDARLTADREEQKYLLPSAAARALADALDARLRSHRFRGDGANVLPGARHFVTTIYFDTPARELYRLAAAPVNLKLRAKEYYDLHPAMVEVATDPRQLVRYQPILWLELKAREHARTRKHRVAVAKREVAAFLRSAGFAALCRDLAPPAALAPSCLVNYRRRAWQDEADQLRVTLDLHVAFHVVPDDLLTRTTPLVRETLPPPAHIESHAIVEVKSTTASIPAWLTATLVDLDATPAAYSKFAAASRRLHG